MSVIQDNNCNFTYKRTAVWNAKKAEWEVLVTYEYSNQIIDYYYTKPSTQDKKFIFNEILSSKNSPNF